MREVAWRVGEMSDVTSGYSRRFGAESPDRRLPIGRSSLKAPLEKRQLPLVLNRMNPRGLLDNRLD